MTAYTRIAVVVLAGAVLFGCATTAQNAKPNSSAAAQNPACLTETGTRVSDAQCRGYGRSYSSADIDRTGKISAADALATLDPSVTVHR
jgi:hypothetical protein